MFLRAKCFLKVENGRFAWEVCNKGDRLGAFCMVKHSLGAPFGQLDKHFDCKFTGYPQVWGDFEVHWEGIGQAF